VPPAVGHIAATPSLGSLDQGLLGHSIWDEFMCLPWPLQLFFFLQEHWWELGAFLGEPSCGLRILFYWICPSSNSHSLSALGDFLEGDHAASDVVLLDMPSSHSHSLSALGDFLGGPSCGLMMLFYWICSSHPHSHFTLAWFASPLSTHHSLTHSTPPGLAVLRSHQALKASAQYFSLVCFFPSPCHLFVHSPSPTGFFHNTWPTGWYGSFGCS